MAVGLAYTPHTAQRMNGNPDGAADGAVVRLRGHGSLPARLEVSRYPLWAWLARVASFVLAWLGGSWLTLVLTFDPFVASFPFVLGIGLVYHGVRGRYRVRSFQGECPRCREPLALKPGSKIPLPLVMTCYSCHHEPELHRAA